MLIKRRTLVTASEYSYDWHYIYDENLPLKKLTIPDGVVKIGKDVFALSNTIGDITIPQGVTEIGRHAFYLCSGLKSISIPESVTKIGKGAFYGCVGLANEDGLVVIRDVLYSYHGQKTKIYIPENVIEIGEYAFDEREDIEAIFIPETVTKIGKGAFNGCKNLTIYAHKDSFAQRYAKKKRIDFIVV